MEVFSRFGAVWRHAPAAGLAWLGLALVWRGLRGGRNGARGLLRRRAGLVGRFEGFRLTVVGPVLVGLGAAWLWQAPALLVLALGIGVVEILESSVVIAALRRDGGRVATNRA